MPFKVSLFTKQTNARSAGWSASFWNAASDLSTVLTATNKLQAAYQRLEGNQTFISNARISDIQKFRAVQTLEYPGTSAKAGASGDSDYETTGLQLALYGPNSKVVTVWITGVPDNIIQAGGFFQVNAQWGSRFLAFKALLLNGQEQWRLRIIDPANPFKLISGITNAGVVTCTNHGYADDTIVRIQRVKGMVSANKIWQITNTTTNTFQLVGWVVPDPATPYTGGGKVQKQTYALVPITDMAVIKATSHKRGRPFALASGKSKSRKKR